MKKEIFKKWGFKLGVALFATIFCTNIPIYASAEDESNITEAEYSLDSDALYNQYIEFLMTSDDGISIEEYEGEEADTGYYAAKTALTKHGKIVYELLKEEIIKISNGERDSTTINIPYSSVYGADETFTFTASELNMTKITDENINEAQKKVFALISDNAIEPGLGEVYDAIVADVAYYLYWSTGNVVYSSTPIIHVVSHTDDTVTVKPSEGEQYFRFSINVNSTYSNGDYTVDTSKTSVAKSAFDHANNIVNQAKSMSDTEKLTFYKNSICDLADYAFNTWIGNDHRQIIYVFDNDRSTKVVCEGYAKAFKYLCDLTTFSSPEIECRLAAGYLMVDNDNPERHMWNIVQLKKNENYLVDVTNCDEKMFASPDILFMKGHIGKLNQVINGEQVWGYQLAHPSRSVFYYYDNSNYNTMRSTDELTLVSEQQSKSQDSEPYKNCVWEVLDGKSYWYEENVRQGTASDSKCFSYDGTLRGREIYDPTSVGWYWLDVNADGAKAVGKEVFMPYIYQNEATWRENEEELNKNAENSGANAEGNTEHAELAEQVKKAIQSGTGKWVRYDNDGKMLKGWITIEGDLAVLYPNQAGNRYYYDRKTGLMAKGETVIDGVTYYFDEITGVLK